MKADSVKSAAGFGGKALTFALTAYILALMSLRCKKTDAPNTTGYYHDLPGGPRRGSTGKCPQDACGHLCFGKPVLKASRLFITLST